MFWINHHRLFSHIRRTDNTLLVLNLLLLLVIVFIPYPTALLVAQYTAHPDQHDAALIYSGTSIVLVICFNLLWRYASYKNRLLGPKTDLQAVRSISKQYLFGPLLYCISFALAWINVPASIIMSMLLALFFALPSQKLYSKPDARSSTNEREVVSEVEG